MLRVVIFTIIFLIHLSLISQTDKFRVSELSPYLESYINPFAKALSTGMSGGWNNTAAVYNTLGFDISINATLVNIPTSDHYFNTIGLLGSNYLILGTKAPTISADKSFVTPLITRNIFATGNIGLPLTFPALNGFGLDKGASMAIQGSIGLPKGTELTVRLIPETKTIINNMFAYDNGFSFQKTYMWGVGAKHNIVQWIPGVRDIPFFEMSVSVNYSRFYSGIQGTEISLTPQYFSEQGVTVVDNEQPGIWEGQSFNLQMSSIGGEILIGASFSVVHPFVGVGFSNATFNAGLKGNYPIIEYGLSSNLLQTAGVDVNPVNINTKESSLNIKAGLRVKLSTFMMYYTYTHQHYSLHSVGVGISVGNKYKS